MNVLYYHERLFPTKPITIDQIDQIKASASIVFSLVEYSIPDTDNYVSLLWHPQSDEYTVRLNIWVKNNGYQHTDHAGLSALGATEKFNELMAQYVSV